MRSILTAVCLAAVTAFAAPAFAGYTVNTGVDLGTNSDAGNDGATIGDSFTVLGGTFSTYAADGPTDPQLTGSDLPNYRYNLTATVASVGAGTATYTGDYLIFYDVNLDGNYSVGDGDIQVSLGTLASSAAFFSPNSATFTGQLFQTSGPTNPAFADLSYGGNPSDITGNYVGLGFGDGSQATFQAVIRQDGPVTAPVPEPATMALLAMGLPLYFLRRRRVA